MPPKKSNRTSMPARVSAHNGTTLTPSRRSPRVPVTGKSINQTPQSTKSLDLSSTPHSDSSLNFRFYDPKTPSTTGRSRNSSPDLPSTRRRTFQARRSRLSTVYPPTLDTPTSNQTTRQTRRTSTLNSPPNHLVDDDELSESVGSTGWTYDQYTGGLDNDESMARAISPSDSSSTTRRSTRERKPTLKAMEAKEQEQQQQVRRKKTKAAARVDTIPTEVTPVEANVWKNFRVKNVPEKVPENQVHVKLEPDLVETPAPTAAPTEAAPAEAAPASTSAPPPTAPSASAPPPTAPSVKAPVSTKPAVKRGPKKTKDTVTRGKTKVSKKTKPVLRKLEVGIEQTSSRLFNCAVAAFGPNFELPSDPEKVIADARRSFEQGLANAEKDDQATARKDDQDAARKDDQSTAGDTVSIKKFKKLSTPRLEDSGWALAGRTNENGEELVVTPPTNSPYRSPNTYGDEALPQPPVRSRSELDVEKDITLGFPPLLGDRNIPFSAEARFQPEDVIEEQARVKARGKARQKHDSGSAGPTQTGKKSRVRKPRETKAAKVETSAAALIPGDGKSKPAQRRGARATKAAAIENEPEEASVEKIDKPKIRLRLTLKPQAPEVAPTTATTPAPVPAPAPAAPTRGKSAKPSVPRGKKRALDLTSEVEPANKAPSKRARRAPRN